MRAALFWLIAIAITGCAAPAPYVPPGEHEEREQALDAEIDAARSREPPAPELDEVESLPATTESDVPRLGIANVETVEVEVVGLETAARSVVAEGSHPDPCTEIHEVTLVRRGSTFQFAVSTLRPPGSCAAVATRFAESLRLEVADLPPGTYTVVVNGASAEFTLGVDDTSRDR
jgi:hypothetical protein